MDTVAFVAADIALADLLFGEGLSHRLVQSRYVYVASCFQLPLPP
jgi:hypothetical protein